MRLEYYKNNAAHFFISIGCLSQAILTAHAHERTISILSNHMQQLLERLKHEFYVSAQNPETHIHHLMKYLEKINAIRQIDNVIYPENQELLSIFSRVVRGYLEM